MVPLERKEKRHKRILRLLLEGDSLLGLGEEVFIAGQQDLCTSAIWFVKEGMVRRYRSCCNRDILIDVCGASSVVCSIEQCAETDRFVATPGTALVRIPLEELVAIGRRQPDVLATLIVSLSRRHTLFCSRLLLGVNGAGASCLAALLGLLADEIGQPCSHGRADWIDMPALTHQDLADLLNRTRPHVTGLVNQLIDKGLLVRERGRGFCVSPYCTATYFTKEIRAIDSCRLGV